MAKKPESNVPETINSVEALQAKIASMREAQKKFASYTQEQVDKIFFEAAMAANKQRIPLARMACEETARCHGRQSHQKSLCCRVHLQCL